MGWHILTNRPSHVDAIHPLPLPAFVVPVITQLLQVVFAGVGVTLGFALRSRSRQAGRLCLAGGLVLLAGAAFEFLWLNVIYSVFGAGARPGSIAGAFAVEFIEAVLDGLGWMLLLLAAFAGRRGVPEGMR